MDFYIPLIFYIVFVSYFFREKKWVMYLLTLIPLILFWGTKVDFGPDYGAYLYKFETQHNQPFLWLMKDAMEGKFEPGFILLIKIMPSFDALVFFTSTFLLLSAFMFFDEFAPKYSIPMVLFLWLFNSSIFNTFSAMRSSYVIAFFLLAIIAKTRTYNKIAFLLVLLGAQFHMSGYLLIIFTVIPRSFFHNKRRLFMSFIIVFILLSLLVPALFSKLVYSLIVSNENLSVYEDHVQGTDYGLGFLIFTFFRIGFVVYILSLFNRNLIEDKYFLIAGLTIFCYLFMMVQGISIMYRFYNYLFLATVIFKCYVLKIDKTIVSKIYVGLSILYALYNFYGYMHSDYMSYYEHYHSFLL